MRAAIRGTFATAGQDVRRQPLRTVISIAGLVAAIVSVIVVNAASDLSLAANTEFIAWQYGRPATVSITAQPELAVGPVMPEPQHAAGPRGQAPVSANDPTVAADVAVDMLALLDANGVPHASLFVDTQLWYRSGRDLVNTRATIVSPEYPRIKVIDMQYGMFPASTATSDAIHVVVTEQFARSQGWEPQAAIGKALEVAPAVLGDDPEANLKHTPLQTMIIDGVARWAGDESGSQVLVVTELARPDLFQTTSINLLAHIDQQDMAYVNDLLQAWAGSEALNLRDLSVQRVDLLGQLAPVLEQQNVTAMAVSIVALMIGGLGILGVGLANVRQRASEFGVRRALGASTDRVFFSVIVQTLLEVLIAAAIAIPLAAIVVGVFARQLVLDVLPLPADTSLPVSSAVLGLSAALGVGLLAGLFPAIRAARLSVVQALRD